MDDILTVMDAVGTERAAILGWSEATIPCAMFAATYPQRTSALIMYGGLPRALDAEDYPWGVPAEAFDEFLEAVNEEWGRALPALALWAPSRVDDPGEQEWFARYGRLAVSPGAAVSLFRSFRDTDIRDILATISVPTLLIHRTDDTLIPVENARYMAEQIPGAKLVELPGEDHLWWFGDQDEIVGRGAGVPHRPSRRRTARPGPGDRDVHRHRRPRPSARPSSATGGGASCWRATRTVVRRELDPAPRTRGEDDRRRLPRDLRRPGARDLLRPGDLRRRAPAGDRGPRRPAHGRVRGDGRRRRRDRGPHRCPGVRRGGAR